MEGRVGGLDGLEGWRVGWVEAPFQLSTLGAGCPVGCLGCRLASAISAQLGTSSHKLASSTLAGFKVNFGRPWMSGQLKQS